MTQAPVSPAPTLTGRDLGQAERATRAVLDRLLAQSGLAFLQWVALGLLEDAGPDLERDGLVRQMAGALKIDEPPVLAAVDELVRLGLVASGPAPGRLELTPAGRRRLKDARDGVDRLTERLYGGLPQDDLATAHRVLALITERANAELTP
jgi:DNA-binding MarR family transcriptional regulator